MLIFGQILNILTLIWATRIIFLFLRLTLLLRAPGCGDISPEEGGFSVPLISQCVRVCVSHNTNV